MHTTEEKSGHGSADEGFTLIELLVVMIIIGILASIAIPTYLNQRRNAVNAGQVADLRSVADEVEGFYVNNETYPDVVIQAGSQVTISSTATPGIQRVTVGNTVTYVLDPTGIAYCLKATNPKAGADRYWVSNAGGLQPLSVVACPF